MQKSFLGILNLPFDISSTCNAIIWNVVRSVFVLFGKRSLIIEHYSQLSDAMNFDKSQKLSIVIC